MLHISSRWISLPTQHENAERWWVTAERVEESKVKWKWLRESNNHYKHILMKLMCNSFYFSSNTQTAFFHHFACNLFNLMFRVRDSIKIWRDHYNGIKCFKIYLLNVQSDFYGYFFPSVFFTIILHKYHVIFRLLKIKRYWGRLVSREGGTI